jgi:hypothetical protein
MDAKPLDIQVVTARAQEQSHYVEKFLVQRFVKQVNEAIKDQSSSGKTFFEFSIPRVVFGFPCFNADYIANEVSLSYRGAGYTVTRDGLLISIKWNLT